ncbi:hypothetical protein HN747_04410 [archaeon]|jgi:hypothetical protein|nr:hypothetical protein [archaeon]
MVEVINAEDYEGELLDRRKRFLGLAGIMTSMEFRNDRISGSVHGDGISIYGPGGTRGAQIEVGDRHILVYGKGDLNLAKRLSETFKKEGYGEYRIISDPKCEIHDKNLNEGVRL